MIIDVSIIAVDLNNEYKQGVDWSKFELGFNSYIATQAQIQAQEQAGQTKEIA